MTDSQVEPYFRKLAGEIEFIGVQFDQGQPYGYLFTDRKTGSSFLILKSETDYEKAIIGRLKKLRESFKEGLCYGKSKH